MTKENKSELFESILGCSYNQFKDLKYVFINSSSQCYKFSLFGYRCEHLFNIDILSVVQPNGVAGFYDIPDEYAVKLNKKLKYYLEHKVSSDNDRVETALIREIQSNK